MIGEQGKEMHLLLGNHLIWRRKLSDIEVRRMVGSGEEQREAIRHETSLDPDRFSTSQDHLGHGFPVA